MGFVYEFNTNLTDVFRGISWTSDFLLSCFTSSRNIGRKANVQSQETFGAT